MREEPCGLIVHYGRSTPCMKDDCILPVCIWERRLESPLVLHVRAYELWLATSRRSKHTSRRRDDSCCRSKEDCGSNRTLGFGEIMYNNSKRQERAKDPPANKQSSKRVYCQPSNPRKTMPPSSAS